ncbi:MAG: cyclophilin-like fold protein [archaeon]
MTSIVIETEGKRIEVWLNNTQAAKELMEKLPLESTANLWGEEIFFYIKHRLTPSKDAKEEVRVGDFAYWPPGPGLCLFFGKTPASKGDEPRAANPVTVIGQVVSNIEDLKKIKNKDKITVRMV